MRARKQAQSAQERVLVPSLRSILLPMVSHLQAIFKISFLQKVFRNAVCVSNTLKTANINYLMLLKLFMITKQYLQKAI